MEVVAWDVSVTTPNTVVWNGVYWVHWAALVDSAGLTRTSIICASAALGPVCLRVTGLERPWLGPLE